jgi:SAM-dependent methyltransferase
MSQSPIAFNRQAVRRHRARAAPGLAGHDFLYRETAERLADRLADVTRAFPLALDLGCHTGQLSRALQGRGGIGTLVQGDLSPAMARAAAAGDGPAGLARLTLACDEESLPFKDGAFDLVLSSLSLHWVNDLPGALIQIRRSLKKDGLFLANVLGGDTLKELRQALAEAEIAEEDGLSPRVSPMADVRDLGGLLQRAGFALPVVDADTLTVSYADPMALMADLGGMGESNAVELRRRGFTRRATLAAAADRYRALFGGADGRVNATFQMVTLTGWAPDPSQPQALRPGSAAGRLADALGTDEVSLGEKAKP